MFDVVKDISKGRDAVFYVTQDGEIVSRGYSSAKEAQLELEKLAQSEWVAANAD